MAIGIGASLRKARKRRELSLSEIEAATKIRARFLRAIEDEEWGALPGDVYARSFVRTYATYLGLDGERLADEYRRHAPPAGERDQVPAGVEIAPPRRSRLPAPSRGVRLAATAAIVAGLAGAAIAIGLATGEGEPTAGTGAGGETGPPSNAAERGPERPDRASPATFSLELTATAEVWVCLLDERGRPLVDGQILPAGAVEGPFRSGSFTASFGNGEISMTIDGQEAEIPATPSPVGYAIGGDGSLVPLAEGERPECL